MKTWLKSVLPALSVAVAVLLAGNATAAATGHSSADAASASANTWIAKSGLPPAAARVLQSQVDRQIAGYGGIEVSPYEVSYNGGDPPCSDGGRLLQFQSCGTQSLAAYGFSGQTSSWVNNTSAYVAVYNTSAGELWSESPGSASSYVGSANNDRADNFWIIC